MVKDEQTIANLKKLKSVHNGSFGADIDIAIKALKQQPKTGYWIIKDGKEQGYDIFGTKTWYIQIMCDRCGFIKTAIEGHTGQYKYCPSCGAKMENEDI